MPGDETIRLSRGFGQSKARAAFENQTDGGFEADSMPDAHEHRPHIVAGSNNGADDFSVIPQGNPAAPICAGLVVLPGKQTLCAADHRHVENHAQVTRKAESTRVGISMTVSHQRIGYPAKASHCVEQGRALPKGE